MSNLLTEIDYEQGENETLLNETKTSLVGRAYSGLKRAGKYIAYGIPITGLMLSPLVAKAEEPIYFGQNANVRTEQVDVAPQIKLLQNLVGTQVPLSSKKPSPPKKYNENVITLDPRLPLDSSDANSNWWYNGVRLIDSIGESEKLKFLDETFFGRLAKFSSLAYLSMGNEILSHEFAHGEAGKRGGNYSWTFNLKDPLSLSKNFKKRFRYVPTDKQLLDERKAGLIMDSFDLENLFKNWDTEISPYEANSFLLSRKNTPYNLFSQEPKQLDDVEEFVRLLNKKGIKFSKEDHLKQALFADIFSVATWDSIWTIANYLIGGEKSNELSTFKINNNEYTFPNIAYYLTDKGGWYNATVIANPKDANKRFSVSFGFPANYIIGAGEEDTCRIEISGKNVRLNDRVSLKPSVALNSNGGGSIGLDANINLSNRVILSFKNNYSQDDMLQQRILGKGNGLESMVLLKVFYDSKQDFN
ncbi:MAG: hypothetical protein ABH804_01875 [archaeon]